MRRARPKSAIFKEPWGKRMDFGGVQRFLFFFWYLRFFVVCLFFLVLKVFFFSFFEFLLGLFGVFCCFFFWYLRFWGFLCFFLVLKVLGVSLFLFLFWYLSFFFKKNEFLLGLFWCFSLLFVL